ncbi:hypothetical protein [Streptomyces variegatus]|uniref:hypothetical protein n=1 Tax=Streptomyces variegatus TaxID=284040 RepID=UPI003C2B52EA
MTNTDTTSAPAGTVLPPFTGTDRVCAKCRYLEAFTRYRPPLSDRTREEFNGSMRRGPLPERLERTCARCDFAWDEALPVDDHADGGLSVDHLVHALDNSTPYPVELDPALLAHMATKLLEMVVALPVRDHPVWQPEEEPPPAVAPQDPDTLATPEA